MIDFQTTLNEAHKYAKEGDYALATFHYWLIGFTYENEEFHYGYNDDIGKCGRKGFIKYVTKFHTEILSNNSYINFKSNFSDFPSYQIYFLNFERVVNSFINRKNR